MALLSGRLDRLLTRCGVAGHSISPNATPLTSDIELLD
jgi:hypothetical protein